MIPNQPVIENAVTVFSCIDNYVDDEHLKLVEKVVEQLRHREYQSADMDQKEQGLFTARMNDKCRLFFTLYAGNIYLLEMMLDHRYDRVLPRVKEQMKKLKYDIAQKNMEAWRLFTMENTDVSLTTSTDEVTKKSKKRTKKTITIEIEKWYPFQDTFIHLNEVQQKIFDSPESLMVVGTAGSGKSSTIVCTLSNLLRNEETQPESKILVSSKYQHVLNKLTYDLKMINPTELNIDEKISFTDIKTLITQYCLPEEFTLADKKAFNNNYSAYQLLFSSNKKKSNNNSLFMFCKFPEEIQPSQKNDFLRDVLYAELCLLAGYNGKYEDEHGKILISQAQSYFSIHDNSQIKGLIRNVFNAHREYLICNQLFDPAISVLNISFEPENKPFDWGFFDEGQLISPNELRFFMKLVKKNKFFLDHNQNTLTDKPLVSFMQTVFQEEKYLSSPETSENIPIYYLSDSYRCSTQVQKLANYVLSMRDFLSNISMQNYSILPNYQEGSTYYFLTNKRTEKAKALDSIKHILENFKDMDVIIVIDAKKGETSDEHERRRQEIIESFKNRYIVCFPDEIGGLEFPAVFIYNPFGVERDKNLLAANEKIKNCSPDKKAQSMNPIAGEKSTDTRFNTLFQSIYMTITRASKIAIVLQERIASCEQLFSHFAKGFSSSTLQNQTNQPTEFEKDEKESTINQTTREDWINRIKSLLTKEHCQIPYIKKLVRQHIYPDVPNTLDEIWLMFQTQLPQEFLESCPEKVKNSFLILTENSDKKQSSTVSSAKVKPNNTSTSDLEMLNNLISNINNNIHNLSGKSFYVMFCLYKNESKERNELVFIEMLRMNKAQVDAVFNKICSELKNEEIEALFNAFLQILCTQPTKNESSSFLTLFFHSEHVTHDFFIKFFTSMFENGFFINKDIVELIKLSWPLEKQVAEEIINSELFIKRLACMMECIHEEKRTCLIMYGITAVHSNLLEVNIYLTIFLMLYFEKVDDFLNDLMKNQIMANQTNQTVDTIDIGRYKNISVPFVLAMHEVRFDLSNNREREAMFFALITEHNLNAIVSIKREQKEITGISLAFLLASSVSRELLAFDNMRFASLISQETLNTIILGDPNYQNMSVAFLLGAFNIGRDLLRKDDSRLLSLINQDSLNSMVLNENKGAISLADILSTNYRTNVREIYNFWTHNNCQLLKLLDEKCLTEIILKLDNEGRKNGQSFVFELASSGEGIKILLKNGGQVLKKLDKRTLNRIFSENGTENSIIDLLMSTDEGKKWIIKNERPTNAQLLGVSLSSLTNPNRGKNQPNSSSNITSNMKSYK